MQIPHAIDLPTLEPVIIPSHLNVKKNTLVVDVITLMSQGRGSELSLSDEDYVSGLNLPSQNPSSCALVIEDTQVIGIFTERDVVRAIADGVDLSKTEIAQVMTQPVITLALSATKNVLTALSAMRQHRIRHLPVVDEQGKLVGLVTQDRLYQAIAPAQMLRLTQQAETAQLEAKPKRPKGKRKTGEISLSESEERYRLMFESNPNPMWFYDPETLAFLEVNQAAIAHYGYSKEEFLQMTIADIRPPGDVPALRQVCDRLLPGQPYIGIWQHYKKDGSIIDVEVNAHAFPVAGRQANLVLIQDITELRRLEAKRQQAEADLHAGHQRTIAVWESMTDACTLLDREWRVVYANATSMQVMCQLANLEPEAILGKSYWELFPWTIGQPIEREYRRAMLEQVSIDLEVFYEPTGSWFEIHGYPSAVGLILYYRDISDRKQTQEELRRVAEIDAFRVALTDALRPLADPLEVQTIASRVLGEYLGVTRVAYFEIRSTNYFVECDYVNGVPALAGGYAIESFGAKLLAAYRTGRPVFCSDVNVDPNLSPAQRAAYAAIQIGSYIGIPLIKDGEFVAGLAVHMCEPRVWTSDEVALVEEVAERTWAAVERSRAEAALRESEAKYRTLFNSIDEGLIVCDVIFAQNDHPVDIFYVEANAAAVRIVGQELVGRRTSDISPDFESEWFEILGRVARTGEAVRMELPAAPLNAWYEFYAFRPDAANNQRVSLIYKDITERKRREANLAILAEVADDCSRLSSCEEMVQAVGAKIGKYLNVTTCNFCEVDEEGDEVIYLGRWNTHSVPRLPDRICLSEQVSEDFYRRVRAGETIVSHNTQTNPVTNAQGNAEIGALSFITVPFHHDGEWKYLFSIHDEVPRTWREDEIEVVREVANRLFPRLERARAEAMVEADLKDTQLLRELSARLTTEANIQVLYDEIVAAAIALTRADAGTVQIFDQATQDLILLAAQGFERQITEHFYRVNASANTSCAMALATGDRAFVDFDVVESANSDGSLRMLLNAGYLSAQSTPLVTRSGKSIGMVSTHWRQHHRPSDRELRFLDLLARQAADLIEQRQAEAALREAQESLTIAIEAAQMGTWHLDLTQDFASKRSLRHDQIFGYETSQLEWGEAIARRHIVEADREIFDAAFGRARETGKLDFEVRVQWPDGSIHWMAARGRFYFDENGNPVRGGGVNFDISDRKQAEADLEQSEQKFRAIFDSTFQFMGVLTTQGILVEANQTALDLIAANPVDVIGKPFWETPWWTDFPQQQKQLQQAIVSAASGEFVRFECQHIWADGTLAFVDFSLKPVFDGEGKVVMLISEGRDISDRKLAEQKIAEQAALIDIATDAINVRDLDNRVIFWSQGAERLYGWKAAEAVGKNFSELVYPDISSEFEAAVNETLEKGSWQGELEKVTKTGKKIVVASRWTLVRDESGQPKSILVVSSDITEKKQLERQFYRAQRLESLGTLASGIAHDLNNVFTPILMISQLLPLKFKDIDRQTEQIFNTLEDSTKRGVDLVKQILTFARGTEGKHIVLQVGHLLKEIAKIAQQTFPKSIKISADIPANALWSVKADPTQLHQVLMNIAVNSRDAMPDGGMLSIWAENRFIDQTYAGMNLDAKEGNYIVITIADTGIGIPPEIIDRIFDPFFTTKEVGKGTGLGLSTVIGIIKNHGGFLQVLSEVGKGTQFQVYLPAAAGTVTEVTTDTELFRGNGELILIVDDESPVQQITTASLEEHNYKTLLASDGIEAIALYAEHSNEIDVVLIDMMMPNMDGLTAIRTMKALNPQVKIIASSGLFANSTEAIALGAKAFLLKPYTAQELLQSLWEAIGNSTA